VVRRMAFGALLMVLVQAGIGMAVNLYVTVPDHHPGAHPADYLTGSFDSVVWALGHGGVALAVHAFLGLGLIVMTVSVAVRSLKVRRRSVVFCSFLAMLPSSVLVSTEQAFSTSTTTSVRF